MKTLYLTGQRFGRLTVIERVDNRGKKVAWKCMCDCGKETVVMTTALRSGNTMSCGCLNREKITKHGMNKSRTYKTWANMLSRCYCKSSTKYKNYGGRGITVCDEWKNSFQSFYDWAMTNGYSDELTIDRINVNGNYEPSNCRWITNIEQQNNRQYNVRIKYKDTEHTLAEWERILGIKKGNLHHMLKKKSFDEIVKEVWK